MSIWTHVAATIRFDAIRLTGFPSLRPNLGNTCTFESSPKEWDACDVPCGSEGSLQYHILENPRKEELAAYVVTIWGDLRSYDNVEEIIGYLNRITTGTIVRQGCCVIEVEGKETVFVAYGHEERRWVSSEETDNE